MKQARSSLLVLIGLVAALSSCIDVPKEPAKDALDVKDVTVSAGVGLETACTPAGPEICFDARDNNCNGVIDEGCGVRTGLLQFVVAWEASDADVDLNVYDPNQELVRVGDVTSAGLQKDKDCPRSGECQGQNVENVFLVEGEPKKGKYKVVVHLEKLNGATPPVTARLGVRMGSRSYGMTVALSPGATTEDKEFSFVLR